MSDLLSRFSHRHADPAIGETETLAATPTRSYEALKPEPQARRIPARLRIVYGDGVVSLMSYPFLSEVLCTSPQFLSLIYAHCVITLEGRNLTLLVDVLQEDKARTLTCFNPRLHDAPEPGAPIITRIARQVMTAPREADGATRQRSPGRTTDEVSR